MSSSIVTEVVLAACWKGSSVVLREYRQLRADHRERSGIGLDAWGAGAPSQKGAQSNWTAATPFTGGTIRLMQYLPSGTDYDVYRPADCMVVLL